MISFQRAMASLSTLAIAIAPLLLLVLLSTQTSASNVGVCYGMMGDNLPPPSEVIALYKSHNIGLMRLYEPNHDVLQALRGSNIQLILDVSHQDLQRLAEDRKAATNWVQTNILAFPDVAFRYISVGNELIPENPELAQFIYPAMRNIQTALASARLQNKIKVSTSVSQVILGASSPPSAGAFSSAASPIIGPIIQFLAYNKSPLLVNVYTYYAYTGSGGNMDIRYALFTSPGTVVQDGQHAYQNLFDAIADSIYSALEKKGGANVKIVVSETGWPSVGGGEATSVANAQTYNSNLIKHVSKGTPKKPNVPIETYIFAMFNENKKAAGTENHFGLFFPDKQPVYPITFN